MKNQKLLNLKIHLVLILVSGLFGVNYVLSKVVLRFMPPGAWALSRVFLTSLFLIPLVFNRLRQKPPTGRQWLTMGYLGLFGLVINLICFFEGLSRTTATHAAIINTSIPLFVLFFSILFREEKLNWHRVAGMALGVIGVLIVLEVEKERFDSALFLGDILNLLNSMSFGLYLVLSRPLNREMNPLVVTTGMFMISTVGLLAYGGNQALHVPWLSLPLFVYLAMAYVVLGASVGTYSLNNWALSKTDSTMVALYVYLQPVVAGFLSRILYHEIITTRMILASLVVFTGVALGSVFTPSKKGSALNGN